MFASFRCEREDSGGKTLSVCNSRSVRRLRADVDGARAKPQRRFAVLLDSVREPARGPRNREDDLGRAGYSDRLPIRHQRGVLAFEVTVLVQGAQVNGSVATDELRDRSVGQP